KIIEKINLSMENKINKEDMNLKNLGSLLHNLSPLKTLDRGYSIINKENVVVNSISNVSEKDKIEVILSDGSLDCTVDKINKKEV
ncbi:exodeoxyribonuclease VII large subunit, partial [Intestinibacter sp.]